MKPFVFTLLWVASVILAFFGGYRISDSIDSRLPTEFDTFRHLYGESNKPEFSWLEDPRYRVFGRFAIMRPSNNNIPALYLLFTDKQPFPSVMIQPSDDNKRPKGIDLRDKDGNTVSVVDKNQDGVFDCLFLQSGDTLRMDEGLTGTWNRSMNTKAK